MNGFISLKDILDKDVIKRAKDLAWDTFPTEAQEAFLRVAQEAQDAHSRALAIKCLEEAEAAFNEPGFISRADPRAYSDHPESASAKQGTRRKK